MQEDVELVADGNLVRRWVERALVVRPQLAQRARDCHVCGVGKSRDPRSDVSHGRSENGEATRLRQSQILFYKSSAGCAARVLRDAMLHFRSFHHTRLFAISLEYLSLLRKYASKYN